MQALCYEMETQSWMKDSPCPYEIDEESSKYNLKRGVYSALSFHPSDQTALCPSSTDALPDSLPDLFWFYKFFIHRSQLQAAYLGSSTFTDCLLLAQYLAQC